MSLPVSLCLSLARKKIAASVRGSVFRFDAAHAEVYRADEMFCTGTLGEIAPVIRVEGRTIGSGSAGPMTLRLGQLCRRLTEREGVRVVE